MDDASSVHTRTVGVVTYHKSLSYGGCLQAYATQIVLESLGYRPFFVDYENPYEARNKTNAVFRYGTAKERVAAVAKRTLYRQAVFHKRAFKAFHESLPKTDVSFDDIEQLQGFEADALLVASDQVWNPLITGGLDPVFFLGFGKACRKVSFASSMGSYTLGPGERDEVAGYLEHFDAVSVREAFARAQIQPLVEKDVRIVADPTLQISKERWREAEVQPKGIAPGGYILVFMVSSSPKRYDGLLACAVERLGLPVVQVRLNANKPRRVDCVIPATPLELVWLIDHAALVLTDSFHGLAFSINMESRFAALPNVKNNVRLQELADSARLSDRLREASDCESLFDPLDFSYSRSFFERRRREDTAWLADALGSGCGNV